MQVLKYDALEASVAHLCRDVSGDALDHVGTPSVVRDLERLSSMMEGADTPV
jgi:hypothetical protein